MINRRIVTQREIQYLFLKHYFSHLCFEIFGEKFKQ